MTTITLDVPDELVEQISTNSQRMPHALTLALSLLGEPVDASPFTATISLLISEVIDFLASGPTPTEIMNFKVSQEAQERLELLRDMNREEILSPAEQTELDTYQQIHHLLILLKARTRAISTN